ncbi:hypothetical protein BDV38DRAFT_158496 [Aspergillus pseudotamarii]|uniref:Uncharacterized protein n=1 Tax=Aspergillus pseudotamarii TaxID=132259 RepID=A0A5N6SLH0_ASPPS|nr:uncharacterized protein BDV38DRAFT_158496 [Aspergillus pseudotamarii]KAE8134610.1 hypothetical protein BDV38DRAFT_158496 [Aspergillus pseudotamarii]
MKLLRMTEKAAGIPRSFLRGTTALTDTCIAQRMSWALKRGSSLDQSLRARIKSVGSSGRSSLSNSFDFLYKLLKGNSLLFNFGEKLGLCILN